MAKENATAECASAIPGAAAAAAAHPTHCAAQRKQSYQDIYVQAHI